MSAYRPRPARRRRLGPGLAVGVVVALVVVFGIGVALGEALHDNPAPGGDRTVVRTIEPLQVAPAAATTITVTTGP